MDGEGGEMVTRGSYPSEYYRLLNLGSVDHDWARSLHDAAKAGDEESLQRAIEERGFEYRPEMGHALRELDWDKIRAVADAFGGGGELSPSLIC